MTVSASRDAHPTGFDGPVSLSLPVDGFIDVARLVVGGAASRFMLGFEEIDDIQLAIETVFRAGLIDGDRAVVELSSDAESLTLTIEPVRLTAADQTIIDAAQKTMAPITLLRQLVDSAEPRREPTPALVLRKKLAPTA